MMGINDATFISQDVHELNYVLKKYGKRQTKGNRAKFKEILRDFASDGNYAPHKRKHFYRFLSDTKRFEALEER